MSPHVSLTVIGLSAHSQTNQGDLKDAIGGVGKQGSVNPVTKQVRR